MKSQAIVALAVIVSLFGMLYFWYVALRLIIKAFLHTASV